MNETPWLNPTPEQIRLEVRVDRHLRKEGRRLMIRRRNARIGPYAIVDAKGRILRRKITDLNELLVQVEVSHVRNRPRKRQGITMRLEEGTSARAARMYADAMIAGETIDQVAARAGVARERIRLMIRQAGLTPEVEAARRDDPPVARVREAQ